jgi:hypothetical protein
LKLKVLPAILERKKSQAKALFVSAFQLAFPAEKQKAETNSENENWLLER